MINIRFCSLITKYKTQPSYYNGHSRRSLVDNVGLLDMRPQLKGQVRHWRLFRNRFLAETLTVNKTAMKSFTQQNLWFQVDF